MMAGVVVQINPRADAAVAVVLVEPRPAGSLVVRRRVAPAVAVHHAQRHRSGQRYHERHREVVDDDGHLLVADVVRQHDGPVLSRVVTRELDTLHPVRVREVGAKHARRIPATLNVNQQHGVVCPVRKLTGIVVADVDVRAVVEVAGAALPAGAPAAVRETDEFFAARRHARHGFGHEIGSQRGNSGIYVQRHEK